MIDVVFLIEQLLFKVTQPIINLHRELLRHLGTTLIVPGAIAARMLAKRGRRLRDNEDVVDG